MKFILLAFLAGHVFAVDSFDTETECLAAKIVAENLSVYYACKAED